jgi:AcrR family transcriptional regulator
LLNSATLLEQSLKVNEDTMARPSSQQRREEILDAALTLFRTKGLLQTSTRDLTEVMGISRSHIYHYFPNWQELCLAALDKYTTADLHDVDAMLQGLPPAMALLKLVDSILPYEVDAEWLLYSDTWQASTRIADYRELARKINDGWNALIVAIINRGCAAQDFSPVDAALVARQLSAMINGYADVLALDPSPQNREQALSDILALMTMTLKPAHPLDSTLSEV